jgi:hypothetical protein
VEHKHQTSTLTLPLPYIHVRAYAHASTPSMKGAERTAASHSSFLPRSTVKGVSRVHPAPR